MLAFSARHPVEKIGIKELEVTFAPENHRKILLTARNMHQGNAAPSLNVG